MNLQFCQIIQNQWENNEGHLNSTLFGLSTEGKVYKFVGAGWIELPHLLLENRESKV